MLMRTENIKRYGCLRKDFDLITILEEDLSIEQIKLLLEKKIKILKERKDNMKNFLLNEDKIYFYPSLNQKLHNKIEEL